jgi:tryptophanyl-tRNA synthetase
VNNLLTVYQAFTGQASAKIQAHFEGKLYGVLKREVADVIIESLKPIQQRYNRYVQDAAELDRILRQSAERAAERAAPTLHRAKEAVGFVTVD